MGVVPEKTDGRADHGAAEDGHLRDLGHFRELEIIGKNGVPADIGKNGERSGGDDGAADREPVEAVGKVHGIAGANNDERDKRNERQKRQRRQLAVMQAADHQVRPEVLQERNNQAGGIQAVSLQCTQGTPPTAMAARN